ncbi:metallophosphoesterase [Luteipulveratus flavus]|uniref:Metallophosphoesterase n=1 Tax=Luteipulveratus flavus TaxID=3031728 RepID=A0ABT6CB28_9MICO|nr:metallophosphoesterase [Luteipulveratus sp. YIM 133296]MDF8266100.1 metallophosphoesterase [Luteipulveratus sp. YIM 133296]
MLTIAHLSDTHFGAYEGVGDRTVRAVEHLAAMRPGPDVVLVTGDIADHGHDDEYVDAAAALARWPGPAPLLTCPGNHDVRPAFARHLREAAAEGPLDLVHDVAGVRFVLLDSLVPAPPGERIDHGVLAPESLRLLDGALADGRPTYLGLHHPPVDLHVALMDPIRLQNADELAAVIGRHENLVATLVGHAHTACATTFAGAPLLIGGGIASTVTLDAEALPAITPGLAPTFAVHLVGDDGRVVTHWRTLP